MREGCGSLIFCCLLHLLLQTAKSRFSHVHLTLKKDVGEDDVVECKLTDKYMLFARTPKQTSLMCGKGGMGLCLLHLLLQTAKSRFSHVHLSLKKDAGEDEDAE